MVNFLYNTKINVTYRERTSELDLLVVGGAAFPLACVVHGGHADGTAEELSGAGRHELIHRRGDVHSLVCHEIICRNEHSHRSDN